MRKSAWLLYLFYVTTFIFIPFNNEVLAQESISAAASPDNKDITPTTSSPEAMAFFNEGLALSDLGEIRKARALFTQAVEKDPEMGLAYLLRASTANTTQEWVDDINNGRKRMDNASDWEKIYADYLYTNFTGERERGIELAVKMAEANPNAARAQAELGYAYYGNNQFDKAEEAFNNAVKVNPTWPGGYGGLVNIYLTGEKKNLALAQKNALMATNLKPNSPGAHIILGDTYRAQNNFLKAKQEYTRAIQLDGKAAEGYYKLGHANIYLDNAAEARKNYKNGGELDSRKTFAETLEASSYGYEGDSKRSMKELIAAASKAADSKDADPSAQLDLLNSAATIAAHNGDAATLRTLIPRMMPLSNTVMKSIGTNEAMLYDQADMLRWEIMADVAEEKYDRAKDKAKTMKSILEPLKDGRKYEGYYATMAKIDLKQKKFKDAAEHLKMADPNAIYNTYLLAKAYEGLGDKAKAMNYYKEVSNYNFNNVDNSLIRFEVKKKLKSM